MARKILLKNKILKDPLFWSVILFNIFVIYLYGNSVDYYYNIILSQCIQTFSYAIAHYFFLRNTPIKYIVKKRRLNKTRKRSDKNRKRFGVYIDKDDTGDWIYSSLFLIIIIASSIPIIGCVFLINYTLNNEALVFRRSDIIPLIWAISNGIAYYKNNKNKYHFSNASLKELIAIPFFKLYLPIIGMLSGFIILVKIFGDVFSFIISNPSYWKTPMDSDEE